MVTPYPMIREIVPSVCGYAVRLDLQLNAVSREKKRKAVAENPTLLERQYGWRPPLLSL
jgi:hypothetical protein